jgi:hypothetical protein
LILWEEITKDFENDEKNEQYKLTKSGSWLKKINKKETYLEKISIESFDFWISDINGIKSKERICSFWSKFWIKEEKDVFL